MPNSSFRPITPRVGDLGYVSPGEPAADVFSFSFASEHGTASLCGYSEFTSPSTPPKKYRLKTYSGGFNSTYRPGIGCTGDIVACDDSVFTGSKHYNSATCAVVDASDWTYRTSNFVAPQLTCPAFAATNHYVPPDTWSGDATLSVVNTPTTSTWLPNGSCVAALGNYHISVGLGAVQTLTEEDSETDAIARATPAGSGTSAVSYKETRGAGDFTFLWQNATVEIDAVNLVVGVAYEARISLLTETYGGGSPVVSELVYPFTASATSETIEVPVPAASGTQVTASSPSVVAV